MRDFKGSWPQRTRSGDNTLFPSFRKRVFDMGGGPACGRQNQIRGSVSVALSGLMIHVTERLTDHIKALAAHNRYGGVSMAQVMNSDVSQPAI